MGVEYDLVVNAGRVFCADTGLDGPGAVAVKDGRIVASGPDVSGSSRETLDFPDCVLLPGLVDMHAHPAPSTWKYGIDPDVEILPRGTTTILSQGDSGAGALAGLSRHHRKGLQDQDQAGHQRGHQRRVRQAGRAVLREHRRA